MLKRVEGKITDRTNRKSVRFNPIDFNDLKEKVGRYRKILRVKIPVGATNARKQLWIKSKTSAVKNLKNFYKVAKHNIKKIDSFNTTRKLKGGITPRRSTDQTIRYYRKLLDMIPARYRKHRSSRKMILKNHIPKISPNSRMVRKRYVQVKDRINRFTKRVMEIEKIATGQKVVIPPSIGTGLFSQPIPSPGSMIPESPIIPSQPNVSSDSRPSIVNRVPPPPVPLQDLPDDDMVPELVPSAIDQQLMKYGVSKNMFSVNKHEMRNRIVDTIVNTVILPRWIDRQVPLSELHQIVYIFMMSPPVAQLMNDIGMAASPEKFWVSINDKIIPQLTDYMTRNFYPRRFTNMFTRSKSVGTGQLPSYLAIWLFQAFTNSWPREIMDEIMSALYLGAVRQSGNFMNDSLECQGLIPVTFLKLHHLCMLIPKGILVWSEFKKWMGYPGSTNPESVGTPWNGDVPTNYLIHDIEFAENES